MRRILFLLFVLMIVASASKGLASTDCERWLAEYKKELAHKASVQRALNARQRARSYARKKVAHLIAPAGTPIPHVIRASSTRPHLTPAQMLKRFDLLCGDLPVEPTNQVLDGRMAPDEFISEVSMGGPVETESPSADEGLIATEDQPPYVPPAAGTTPASGQPLWPVYGPIPTGGGFLPPSPPPPSPIPAVPEPGSIVLLLTGAAGGAGSIWRRHRIA